MGRGESMFMTRDGILTLRHRGNKDTSCFLSTIHKSAVDSVNIPIVIKDDVVADYNKNISFVEKNDHAVSQHSLVRKSGKWATKVFFHLFQESLFNAHVLHCLSPQGSLNFADFKLSFAREILFSMEEINIKLVRPPNKGNHYPAYVPPTEKRKFPVKRCVVCYKNGRRRSSRYYCPDCTANPGLCVSPCFRIHHENMKQ